MAKLIVRLPDGTSRSFALDRDRTTIGRRVDNDLCLPYPAVSAEHALIITIGADSFLEDLGSTNGTLVNGERVAKHFLRDDDVIDVGRLAITYRAHDDEPSGEEAAVEGTAVEGVAVEGTAAEGAAVGGVAVKGAAVEGVTVEGSVEAAVGSSSHAAPDEAPAPISDAEEAADEAAAPADELLADLMESRSTAAAALDLSPTLTLVGGNGGDPRDGRTGGEHGNGATAPPAEARITILTGPHAGEATLMNKAQFVFGRPGVSVAAIRRSGGAYRLVPLAGETPPVVNGGPVDRAGAELGFGDTIEVAGVKLRFERRM